MLIEAGGNIRRLVKKAVCGQTRRHLGGKAAGCFLGLCTSWAVDTLGKGREWIEIVELDLHLANLAEQFRGMRVIHISDLHCSRSVSSKYLRHCIERVNELDADIVLLTGDYITYDVYGKFAKRIVKLLGNISSRYGTYACMGNHDYGIDGIVGPLRHKRLHKMIDGMKDCGINVLRNESAVLERSGGQLWFVGLGDLWADDFKPHRAFADIDSDEAVIALAHNPESVNHMEDFDYDAVLCGHTHGAPLQFSLTKDRLILNRHDYYSGLYELGDRKLYVNRGLGRLGRLFFNTSPEITVFNLCSTDQTSL